MSHYTARFCNLHSNISRNFRLYSGFAFTEEFPTSHESLVTLLREKNIPEVVEWMKYVKETSGMLTSHLLKDEEIEKHNRTEK